MAPMMPLSLATFIAGGIAGAASVYGKISWFLKLSKYPY